jgi:uncharacterized damage-inducible protein DinB
MEVLTGVTASQAAHRPIASAHSAWEIVAHLTTWKRVAARRLRGEVVNVTDEQDWPAVGHQTEAAWEKALSELKAAQQELIASTERLADADLQDKVPETTYNVEFLLIGTLEHDLYHTGQVSLLKKAHATASAVA